MSALLNECGSYQLNLSSTACSAERILCAGLNLCWIKTLLTEEDGQNLNYFEFVYLTIQEYNIVVIIFVYSLSVYYPVKRE